MKSRAGKPRKTIRKYLSRLLAACLFAALFCGAAAGLDRDRAVDQFHHTSWTARDGAPSQISALAQTADGYLWIGSARGLFRFDGVAFEQYVPPAGVTLPGLNIYALMATPDGGLWISFRPSGLGFLKDGQLRIFSEPEELPESQVYCFARDPHGRIWAGTQTGLALFDGARWLDIGSDWNFTKQRIWSLFVDRAGTLWAGSEKTIVFLPPGASAFQETGIRTNGVPQISQANDGRLWMTEWSKPARPIPTGNRVAAADGPEIRVGAEKLLFDRDGGLWMTVYADGIKRLRFPERLGNRKLAADDPALESFKAADGLSDNTPDNLLEDREGNIWVSSTKGLDRFRRSHLVPVKLPPAYRGLTLLAGDGRDGDVFAASASENPVLRISGETIAKQSAPIKVSSVYRGPGGPVWWGGQGGIWKQTEGRLDFFAQPTGANDWFWEIFPADDRGGLWARMGDLDLVYFKDGVWTNPDKPKALPKILPSASFKESSGRLWLGYKDGGVCSLDGVEAHCFAGGDGPAVGRIKVIRGRGPQIWFGGELGLAVFSDGRFRTIAAAGEAFGSVSGIVETPDGALWLNEIHGIVYLSPAEIRRLNEDPEHRANYRLYDFLDGMPGGPQMNFTVSTAIESGGGRLWFATDNGLAWIEPAKIFDNPVPPPVLIRALSAGERNFAPAASLRLPPGTADLRIDYTALSFSIPEKVRFRYRLDGVDGDWRDAGSRRQAFYNNLGPGPYRFRVIACNNDGVWNETGATLDFTIEPLFYQTVWFRLLIFLLAAILLAGLLGLLYRWRLARATERLKIGFEERLAERTRIAHELHDTLLQGFLGAAMRLQAVSTLLPAKSARAKENLDDVLDQIDGVIEEGRRAIWDIHSSTVADNDLQAAFALVGEELHKTYPADFSLTIEGETRPLHPLVRDQLYRIGREALTNAFRHSGATRIELEIEYAPRNLKIFVRDNGCGIRPDYLSAGREGHLGLSGMRDSAEQIGAELKIWSRADSGTEIELLVPHQMAFAKKAAAGRLARLIRLFGRKSAAGRSKEPEK